MLSLKMASTCLLVALAYNGCDNDGGGLSQIPSPTPGPTYSVSYISLRGDLSIKDGTSENYVVGVSVDRPGGGSGPEAHGTVKLQWTASALPGWTGDLVPGTDIGDVRGQFDERRITIPAGSGTSRADTTFTLKCDAPKPPPGLSSLPNMIRSDSANSLRGFRVTAPACPLGCEANPTQCTGPRGCGGAFPCYEPLGCGKPRCPDGCGQTVEDSITLRVVFVDEFGRETRGNEDLQISCAP